MSNENLTIQINPDLATPIVEKKIQAAIIEALGCQEKFIENVAQRLVSQKVNREGKISSYSWDNKHDMVEIFLEKAVRDAVIEAIHEYVKAHNVEVKAAVARLLKNKPSKLSKALVDATERVMGSWEKANVKISFE